MNRWALFKRRAVTLHRIIRTGCINFVRNSWLSIAAIAIMVITLTIVLFSVIANSAFSNTIEQTTDKINISVYLKDTVNEQKTNELLEQIKHLDNVENVVYISKEQAMENFKRQYMDNVDILSAATEAGNPLPATIQIKPRDINKLANIKSFIDKPDIQALQSEKTSYSGQLKLAVDNISKSARLLRRAGIAGVIVFCVISIMIIFNTIQMAIFNRRDELAIMRLLGASTWYIRGPFVVEAVIYGIFSAIISIVLLNSLFMVSSSTLQATNLGYLDIKFANEYFGSHFWIFLGLQMVVGIFIGAVSSIIATHRYLKFKTTK